MGNFLERIFHFRFVHTVEHKVDVSLVNTFTWAIKWRSLTGISIFHFACRRASISTDFVAVITGKVEQSSVPTNFLTYFTHRLIVFLANTSPSNKLEFIGSTADETSFYSSAFDDRVAAQNRGAELSCKLSFEANALLVYWH